MTTSGHTLQSLLQQAISAHQSGDLSLAQRLYHQILAQDAEHIAALSNLGQIARQQRDTTTALHYYKKASAIPEAPGEVWLNLANTYRDSKHYALAHNAYLEAYRRSPSLTAAVVRAAQCRGLQLQSAQPESAAQALNRGEALLNNNDQHAAEDAFSIAMTDTGSFGQAATRLAMIYLSRADEGRALCLLEELVQREPRNATRWHNLATMYTRMQRARKAQQALQHALAIKPDDPVMRRDLANTFTTLGWPEKAHELYQQLLSDETAPYGVVSSYLMALLYDPGQTAQFVADQHRMLTARWPVNQQPNNKRNGSRVSASKALRIGYLSGDLCSANHPVKQFIAPLIDRHTQAGIHCVGFGTNAMKHASAQCAIETLDFQCIAGLSESEAVRRIRAAELDILVDLSGHTQNNRLPYFGQRLATHHVSYLGYPAGTGFKGIDILIADPVVCPIPDAHLYTERVVHLPNCFLCFNPPPGMPRPTEQRRHATVRFGSLNNLPKLNSRTIALWSRILVEAPDTQLLIKCGQFSEAPTCKAMLERFAEHGIAPERLILEPPEPFSQAMLAYERFDIALDTLPYNGGTTSCHALWMGCPLVTLEGDYFVRRMGASILKAADRSQWIARSDEEYVRIALDLARDKSRLRTIQSSLVEDIRQCALTDMDSFANDMLTVYRRLITDAD